MSTEHPPMSYNELPNSIELCTMVLTLLFVAENGIFQDNMACDALAPSVVKSPAGSNEWMINHWNVMWYHKIPPVILNDFIQSTESVPTMKTSKFSVVTVAADDLTPPGARSSAATVMTKFGSHIWLSDEQFSLLCSCLCQRWIAALF